ncbi:uncharacterized protein LOC121378029 [Gigantopelta aegis]|uniref:uncharacterized protein LOC121378029 n=1 Tax=Gigantopelta aegis TaxID=1735272 RepID=UPI001B888675|nr:uncharacterized protein LOC121378029 [Gigantopelta aegis]
MSSAHYLISIAMKLSAGKMFVLPVLVLFIVSEARVIKSPYWELPDSEFVPPSQTKTLRENWLDDGVSSPLSKDLLLGIAQTLKRSYPSYPGMTKRSSLSELIQWIMKIRGDTGEPGRAAVIRFGAGRR